MRICKYYGKLSGEVINVELNDILKIRRAELNLTQKEVADYVGVSEATLSRWESGEIKNLKRNRIAALAKILKLPPSTIVGTLDEEEQIYTMETLYGGGMSNFVKYYGQIKFNIIGRYIYCNQYSIIQP